jgi:hypothetical protein
MGTLVFQATLGGAVNLAGPNTASTTTFTLPAADGTSGQALTTNASGTLAFANIALASAVSGTLPIANGGTNSTATATAGGVGYGTGTAHAYTSAGTSGQVLTSAGAGTPTWATPSGGGKVLQVVQGTKTGATYTTSGTFVTTNVYATITPSSTSSRIMMIATSSNSLEQSGGMQIALYRGTSGNGSGSSIATLGNSASVSGYVEGMTFNWLDSPSSTSALTYTIMQLSRNGSSLIGYMAEQGGTASILLLEIGA